ncbi:hypothetical protein V8F06_007023 [Rhypophila decipiens]
MEAAELLPRSDADKFLTIPYEERWECLKPVIISYYLGPDGGKGNTFDQLVKFMKDRYAFSAHVHQYRHRFKKWDVHKRTFTREKDEIVNALGKRSRSHATTSDITLDHGKPVNKKQLQRYLKDQIRHGEAEPLTPGALLMWNLPYAAFSRAFGARPDAPSPFDTTGTTPTYVNIQSPEAHTPGDQTQGATPTTQLVNLKRARDRSSFLLQARHLDLLKSCGREQRVVLTNYLHDFYIHSYVAAKFWEELGSNNSEHFDVSDPGSWKEWSDPERDNPALTFSHTPPESLPISVQSISHSLREHPDQLRLEAFKAAIMAGNFDLMTRLHMKVSVYQEGAFKGGLAKLYPFHLAASFLDGGHGCCEVISCLLSIIGYRDNLDDTILDAFMISILRSHTSVAPDHVNKSFDPPYRFPGEEKDICGRWDPASPALRNHFQQGYTRIPSRWKHALCHTAVQAICHGIIGIYGGPVTPKINLPSGLFIRRCTNCGLKLELGPLHVLVVVAFYLAHLGMADETLFGPLAILVCLLSLGANPDLAAVISIKDILGGAPPGECHHRPMNAAELMEAVPSEIISDWSRECQTGWSCISHVLRLRETDHWIKQPTAAEDTSPGEPTGDNSDQQIPDEDNDSEQDSYYCELDDDFGIHEEWLCWPRGTPMLRTLWATIQVELLTYRRIEIDQPWISDKFSMVALRQWLEGRTFSFDTPFVTENLMRPYSRCCGWFLCGEFGTPTAQDVCTKHFMNMEVYSRATFLRESEWPHLWSQA